MTEHPVGYWPLVSYIRNETDELLRSGVVNQIDLSIWSQEIGTEVIEFYRKNKTHPQIKESYAELLDTVNSNHKKIKRRIGSPLIRRTSLDEVLEDQGSLVETE